MRVGNLRAELDQIVVRDLSDLSVRQGGRAIERIGFYNPVATGGEAELQIDLPRVDFWLSKGAKASRRVADLIKAYAAKAAA